MILIFGVIIMSWRQAPQTRDSDYDELIGQQVKIFVTECLKKTTEDGIEYISLRGGYYDVPALNSEFMSRPISVHWHYTENHAPSTEVMEAELSKYITDNINDCIGDFQTFTDSGYKIDSGVLLAEPMITEDSVIVDTYFPLDIDRQGVLTKQDKFFVEVPSYIMKQHTIAEAILQEHQEFQNSIPVSYLIMDAREKGYRYDILHGSNDTVLYSIIFEDELIHDYSFAARYDW
ncbi:hypothetical protein GF345_04195 [Candidatus Woesearchaeota archaeon]|nr:hypothetical protein [Candidatus Woesearchaeota archaeon]